MRRFALIALPLLLLAPPAGSALAQIPAALPSATSAMPLPSARDAVPALFASPPDPPPTPRWSLDLLLGLPTGLRVQRQLGESPWFAEGIAGVYVVPPFVGGTMLGGGFRRCFTPFAGEYNALCISPGIDAYLASFQVLLDPGKHAGGVIAADVDVLWRHTYGKGCQGDLGVNLGRGRLVSGRGADGCRSLAWSLVCGFESSRFARYRGKEPICVAFCSPSAAS